MHPVLNVASPHPQVVGKQFETDGHGPAFAVFAVDGDQGGPAVGPSKKLPPSITRLPNSIASVICAILGPTNGHSAPTQMVERHREESSALASGGLGERNGEIGFNRLCRRAD
jgi:hypothetical protein